VDRAKLAKRIEADPRKAEYMDASMVPVVDDREAEASWR